MRLCINNRECGQPPVYHVRWALRNGIKRNADYCLECTTKLWVFVDMFGCKRFTCEPLDNTYDNT